LKNVGTSSTKYYSSEVVSKYKGIKEIMCLHLTLKPYWSRELYCLKDGKLESACIHLRIEFHSGCIYWIMNAMVKLANPWSALKFVICNNVMRQTYICYTWFGEPPRNVRRLMWLIQPTELDNYIGSFLLSIRTADVSAYEPDTLTCYHRGLDR